MKKLLFLLLTSLLLINCRAAASPGIELVSGPGGEESLGWTESDRTAELRFEFVLEGEGSVSGNEIFPIDRPFFTQSMHGHISYNPLGSQCNDKHISLAATIKTGADTLVPISVKFRGDQAQPVEFNVYWPDGFNIDQNIQVFIFADDCLPSNFRGAFVFFERF